MAPGNPQPQTHPRGSGTSAIAQHSSMPVCGQPSHQQWRPGPPAPPLCHRSSGRSPLLALPIPQDRGCPGCLFRPCSTGNTQRTKREETGRSPACRSSVNSCLGCGGQTAGRGTTHGLEAHSCTRPLVQELFSVSSLCA